MKSYRHEENPLDSFLSLSTGEKIWRISRPFVILLVSLVIVYFVVSFVFNKAMDTFYRPVDVNDKSPVTVEIRTGSSSSAIARTLYDEQEDGEPGPNQLIKNKAIFKVFVDFMGMGSKLQSGTYTMNRSMSIPEIVDMLAAGDGRVKQVVRFTLTEGMTVEAMAQSLVSQGVLKGTSRFLELCETRAGLTTHELMVLPGDGKGRLYTLEGYLFPDTYDVFEGSSEETVLNRLITNFYTRISETYILRAEDLGMTIDEVVTLASVIEKEAKQTDFSKVSAVFHNRLNSGMRLQSDATVQYVLKAQKFVLDTEELATDSPYNTYINDGLPIGPICNPGKAALEAALYPDEDFMDDGYLYFCLTDPETGALVFSKTLSEHEENVAKYRELWEQADEAANN